MDLPISPAVRKRRQQRRWLAIGAGGVALCALTVGISRLQPALPRVDKASIYFGTVQRGEMLRQVRGNGTLVPEEIRWIPTFNPGASSKFWCCPARR